MNFFWENMAETYDDNFKEQFNKGNYEYMVKIGDILHQHLLKENKEYSESLRKYSQIKSEIFKENKQLLDEFDYAAANVESEYGIANFMLGLRCGKAL